MFVGRRTFFDAEYYAFDSTANQVDRLLLASTTSTSSATFSTHVNTNARHAESLAAELAASRNYIVFSESFNSSSDTVSLVAPDRGFFGPLVTQTRTSMLDTVSESFEDRLKITPSFALIGGVRIDELYAVRNGADPTGAIEPGFPFAQSWEPVSYRAAYTWEPIPKLTSTACSARHSILLPPRFSSFSRLSPCC